MTTANYHTIIIQLYIIFICLNNPVIMALAFSLIHTKPNPGYIANLASYNE